MSGNRESNKLDTLLTDKDKVNGFSIALNGDRIILLKWNRPLAHFSALLTPEVIKAFFDIAKDCERDAKGKRKAEQNE
jgi:hypothetical protein